MTFHIDSQTFDDLEILSDYDEPSTFSVFNRTLTEGGTNYLKELIRSPTNHKKELEKRTSIIQYLISNPLTPHINSRQLKYVELYSNINIEILKSNPIDALFNRFSEYLKPTNDYYLLKCGCENLLSLLAELNTKIDFSQLPEIIAEQLQCTKNFISELKVDFQSTLPPSQKKLIKLDRFFRKDQALKLKKLLKEIYFIDAFCAIAKTAREESFTLPEYKKSKNPLFSATQLRHPLLPNAVVNDVEIGKKENLCFLTGPNMAGKSTFLKSIGVCMYLAHVGLPVPAKNFTTSLYDGMITTINLADNLNFGYSHFYSEVNRVKEAAIALAEGKQMLVIFDELFRGTNVKDAFDASNQIIKGFAEIKHCTFFVSTHITEIAKELKESLNISFKYFDSALINNELKYSYKLKTGVSTERLGMHIIRSEGIFDILNSIKSNVL